MGLYRLAGKVGTQNFMIRKHIDPTLSNPTEIKLSLMSSKQARTATYPDIWHKSILKKQADQEKMRIAVLQQLDEALNILEKKYQWEEAYLFGSIVIEGRFRRNSDIDVAVLGLRKYDYYKFIGEISDLVDKRVDVVLLEECHFAPFVKEKGMKWKRKSRL